MLDMPGTGGSPPLVTIAALAVGTLAIGRAGAGTNNIPVAKMSKRGIPVFNAPGANANAVKELVLCGLLLASRGVLQGVNWVNSINPGLNAAELNQLIEEEKKHFKGTELYGKTIGVVGLGAIGARVAEAAIQLGMTVLGYDPAISVDAAWRRTGSLPHCLVPEWDSRDR